MDDKLVVEKAKIMAGGWTQKHLMIRGLQKTPLFNKVEMKLDILGIGSISLPRTKQELEDGIANPDKSGNFTLDRLKQQFYESIQELIEKGENIGKPKKDSTINPDL